MFWKVLVHTYTQAFTSRVLTEDTDARLSIVDQLILSLLQHLLGHLSWARVEVVRVRSV